MHLSLLAARLWFPTACLLPAPLPADGNTPLPSPPVRFNVRDYGAKGDGVTDDTTAILVGGLMRGGARVPAALPIHAV